MIRRRFAPLCLLGGFAACNQLLGNENGRSEGPEATDAATKVDIDADAAPQRPPGPVLGTQRLVALSIVNTLVPSLVLEPNFEPDVATYRVRVPWSPLGIRLSLTATTRDTGDVLTLYGQRSPATKLLSGVASAPIAIDPELGDTLLLDVSHGEARSTYEITVAAPQATKSFLPSVQATDGARLGFETHSMSIDASGNAIVAGYWDGQEKPQGAGLVFERAPSGAWTSPSIRLPASSSNDHTNSMFAFDGVVALGTPPESKLELFVGTSSTTLGQDNPAGFGKAIAHGGGRLAVSIDNAFGGPFSPPLQLYRRTIDTSQWALETPALPALPALSARNALALDPSGNVLVAGLPYESRGTELNAGAAYACNLDVVDRVWFELPSDGKAAQSFWGFGVAASKSFVAVGQLGRVRLFDTTSFAPSFTLGGTSEDVAAGFGRSVALCDTMLVVGAPGATSEDGTVRYSGAVYIYEQDGAEWSLRRVLRSPDSGQQRGFGATVACTARVLVVGAPYDAKSSFGGGNTGDPTIPDKGGALYVFE